MRAGAVLLNVGRGRLVDEEALVKALGPGSCAVRASTCSQREPLPADSPLWGMPNVLVLPHVSATSRRFWRRQTDLIVQNLRRYRAASRSATPWTREAGY
jgi:phosphoglycerate dehydrogenase-like enzyme